MTFEPGRVLRFRDWAGLIWRGAQHLYDVLWAQPIEDAQKVNCPLCGAFEREKYGPLDCHLTREPEAATAVFEPAPLERAVLESIVVEYDGFVGEGLTFVSHRTTPTRNVGAVVYRCGDGMTFSSSENTAMYRAGHEPA